MSLLKKKKKCDDLRQYNLMYGVTDFSELEQFNMYESGYQFLKVIQIPKFIEELAKQMENQDIMAEKVYLANKKNEQAMIDINQVIDKQRKTWEDLTGEVEKYYSKLSSEEVDKGLSIIRAEDKAEKNPNYRISNYMNQSLDKENLSLKEKISLINKNDLAGVGSWVLGMESEGFWEFLNNELITK